MLESVAERLTRAIVEHSEELMNKNKKEKDEDKGDSTQMQTDGPADIAQMPDNTLDGQDKMDENPPRPPAWKRVEAQN